MRPVTESSQSNCNWSEKVDSTGQIPRRESTTVIADFDLLKEPYYIFKRLLRRAFRSMAPRSAERLVDVGCGNKPYADLVHCTDYVGIDVTQASRADVIGDCLHLPFRGGVFDAGICMELLEHVPKPSTCLSEISRILAPGATLALSSPMMWSIHGEPHDYFRFTKYSLKMLLEEHEFQIQQMVRIGGVFSVVFQRLIDVTYVVISKLLMFDPTVRAPIRRAATAIALAPFQVAGYYISLLLDRIDDKDALGWFVVSKKI